MLVIDTNILLEILMQRQSYDSVVASLKRHSLQDIKLGISALTISNVFYLAERHKIPTSRTEQLIADYKVFDVLSDDVDWALAHYKGKDFEDALQIAAALRQKCTVFLTLDILLAKKYGKFLTIELIR